MEPGGSLFCAAKHLRQRDGDSLVLGRVALWIYAAALKCTDEADILHFRGLQASTLAHRDPKELDMGINTERDIEANMQIGPTDVGMVRIFIEADGLEIPMDFDPEEAEEIADEIRAAAQAARAVSS
ncbi:hypothetical protein TM1040_2120 [Ruegeria sp. TM1040]|nr:hypothetical protein TM1040_2120 [Ruegeria sp. TM1040]